MEENAIRVDDSVLVQLSLEAGLRQRGQEADSEPYGRGSSGVVVDVGGRAVGYSALHKAKATVIEANIISWMQNLR